MDSVRALQSQNLLQSDLSPGETIRWIGRPAPGRLAARAAPKALFGLFFGGFAAFWISMALSMTSEAEGDADGLASLFPWFGIPFFLIGLGMVLSPLWEWHKGKRTLYAVTNERVLILEEQAGRRIRSYRPGMFTGLERSGSVQGRGDVVFRTEHVRGAEGVEARPIGFWGVEDAARVEKEIMRLLDQDRESN